jgi:hypothetical protein
MKIGLEIFSCFIAYEATLHASSSYLLITNVFEEVLKTACNVADCLIISAALKRRLRL